MKTFVKDFKLDCGVVLPGVEVVYHTWGRLNEAGDNAIVVCHALTGNSQADDWWGGLIGPQKALDTDLYQVICLNVLGSCYGTTGPQSINPVSGNRFGGAFPLVTVRDTVRLHRRVLDQLGITSVVAAIGGSMGGMQVLEWAFEGNLVKALIPVAVGGRHSAWCIGISETQRQAIYNDPNWNNGFYTPEHPPAQGLALARMIAMISYRSQPSFQVRFGRNVMEQAQDFSVSSYLRYQGDKLVDRFDAMTYVRLTQVMDSHDVSRGRGSYEDVLRSIAQPTLVLGVDSDALYPTHEQEELARLIPDASLGIVHSMHGHDAFLIEFEQLGQFIKPFLDEVQSWLSAA